MLSRSLARSVAPLVSARAAHTDKHMPDLQYFRKQAKLKIFSFIMYSELCHFERIYDKNAYGNFLWFYLGFKFFGHWFFFLFKNIRIEIFNFDKRPQIQLIQPTHNSWQKNSKEKNLIAISLMLWPLLLVQFLSIPVATLHGKLFQLFCQLDLFKLLPLSKSISVVFQKAS